MSDQESRQQGYDKVNPWEAKPKRVPGCHQTPAQQHGTMAMAQTAPWVVTVTAAARPRPRGLKRHLDEDYVSGDELDDVTDVGTDSESDFEDDLQHHIADCDESALRPNHHRSSTRRRRLAQHRSGNMLHNSGRARVPRDPSHPQHKCGRQIIGVAPDVCVVCRKGSDLGELVSCNAAAAGTCDRRYHRCCLLLLNGAGIGVASSSLRAAAAAVVRARGTATGSGGGAQGAHASSSSSGGGGSDLDGVQGYDGLLRRLHQQQQQQQLILAPAVAAAVDTLTSALSALRLQQQQQQGLHVRCPAHYCHGCNLNGKATNLLWCCCCWVRTYHRLRCIPPSAERVTVGGKQYVRCPWCVAAGVAVPSAATAAVAALPSAAPAAAATEARLSADAAAAGAAVPSAAVGAGGPSTAAADARPSAAGAVAVLPPAAAAAARQDAAPATGAPVPSGAATAAVDNAQPPAAAAAATATANSGPVSEADAAAAGEERLTAVVACVAQHAAAIAVPGAVLETQDIIQLKATEAAHTLEPLQQQQQQQREEPQAASSVSTCRSTRRGSSASGVRAGQRGVRQGQQQQQQNAACVVIDLTLDDDLPQVPRYCAAAAAAAGSDVIVIDSDSEDEPACRTSVVLDSSSSGDRTGKGQSRSGAGAADELAVGTLTAAARTPCQPPAQTGSVPANVGHTDDSIHQQQQQQQLLEDADRVQDLQQQQQQQQQPDHSVQVQQLLSPPADLSMPSWLTSALTDSERLNPSFKLVPHAASAAATVQQQAVAALEQAAAAVASRVVVPAAALLSAAMATCGTANPQGDHQQRQQQQGLPLASPQTHWLIGDYAKAESQYKVPGTHGSPVIGVPATGQLYGLCLIIDHMPQSPVLGSAGLGSAGSRSSQLLPRVYLRYGKPGKNISNRRQQQQQQQQGGGMLIADAEAATGDHGGLQQGTATVSELEVLVDGRVLSRGQQVELTVGSVVSVQGLQFRLDTCR